MGLKFAKAEGSHSPRVSCTYISLGVDERGKEANGLDIGLERSSVPAHASRLIFNVTTEVGGPAIFALSCSMVRPSVATPSTSSIRSFI